MTGFRKRKLQRKKEAKEKLERELKEERKRLRLEAKESYKKLVVSHRPVPEIEHLIKDEYEEDDVTVKVIELSTNDIAKKNNWIGANQPKYTDDDEECNDSSKSDEKSEEVPGMELKRKIIKKEPKVKIEFDSEKDVKRELKKQATKNVKKSKIFQMKNKIVRKEQKKKSAKMKKQRMKIHEKKNNKKKR